jgi:hypothetical protein
MTITADIFLLSTALYYLSMLRILEMAVMFVGCSTRFTQLLQDTRRWLWT